MVAKLVAQIGVWYGLMAAVLFWAAGTVGWTAGWVFLMESVVLSLAIGVWMAAKAPGLLAERLSSPIQRSQKGWDKAFMPALLIFWFAWLATMALDAERWRLSQVPLGVQALGALCLPVSMYLCFLTFRENPFAAAVVKIQRERGHAVITTGPYRLVRHPLYAGALFWLIGTPLLLGSWYGLAATPVIIVALGARAVLEERMLTAELDGYADYAARVRWRLIPGVW